MDVVLSGVRCWWLELMVAQEVVTMTAAGLVGIAALQQPCTQTEHRRGVEIDHGVP
jgi:hypothetical protein